MTWQFFEYQLLRINALSKGRLFKRDQPYLDHFNLRPSEVRDSAAAGL
jgi:hypothetical protein